METEEKAQYNQFVDNENFSYNATQQVDFMLKKVMDNLESVRYEAWDKAFHAYGTAYIFEQRAARYRSRLRTLAFLGIVGPFFLGILYLSFRTQQALIDVVALLAGIIGVIQFVVSLWSITAKWEDVYSYALESLATNYRLSKEFETIGKHISQDAERKFALLSAEDRLRSELDNKQALTLKEKREGMRAALKKFRRECVECGQIPNSMKASDCDTCGNF